MAYDIFDFPYHKPNDEYPGGTMIKFGRGYSFAAIPSGKQETICHLNFKSMFIYQNLDGSFNYDVDPQLNVFALETFYINHLMHLPFQYKHHRRGFVVCRFNKPLIMPKPVDSPDMVGGKLVGGVAYRTQQVEPFDMDLLVQPQ